MDHERRRRPRASDLGLVATLVADARTTSCAVESLSASGVRLLGAPPLTDGARVCVRLPVGGRSCEVAADVVRGDASGVALAFRQIEPAIEDAIQDLVLRTIERQRTRTRTVIVLDEDPTIRGALDRNLRRLGFAPRGVATPLDLLRCLEDRALEVQAVFVDLAPNTGGSHILALLRDEYPHVRRSVMAGDRFADLESAITAGRADATLRKPWTQRELARALGIGA